MVLALLTYLPHKTGKLMYWFQTPRTFTSSRCIPPPSCITC